MTSGHRAPAEEPTRRRLRLGQPRNRGGPSGRLGERRPLASGRRTHRNDFRSDCAIAVQSGLGLHVADHDQDRAIGPIVVGKTS